MSPVDEPVHVLEARERFRAAEEWHRSNHKGRYRKAAEWREANKEDIARRVAGFMRAYHKIVEEWRIRITENGGSGPMLVDIDQDDGWVGYFEP